MRSIKVMNFRFMRAFLVGFLLLQGVFLAPSAMALDAGQATADCADHGAMSDNGCPCCPQGVSTYGGCGTICLGVFACVSQPAETPAFAKAHAGPGLPASLLDSQTYTPVNPPPIR